MSRIVTGSSASTNASIGTNNNTAPASSTQVGGIDGLGNLKPINIASDGGILVRSTEAFSVQDLRVLFTEVAAVGVGVETVVSSYTAPVGKISYLLTIKTSGENRGTHLVYNNGVLLDKEYSNVTQLNAMFDYKTGSSSVPGMVIPVGNVIQVRVINSGGAPASYNSRVMILEVEL